MYNEEMFYKHDTIKNGSGVTYFDKIHPLTDVKLHQIMQNRIGVKQKGK